MSLRGKQQRFVEEYLLDLNGAAAARRAGYSERTANEQAARLLAKVSIQDAIQAAQQSRSERTQITADRVLSELALLAFSDIGQVLDFSSTDTKLKPVNEIPEAARRTISSIKVRRTLEGSGDNARTVEVTEFKLWNKDAALEKLGKHLKLFTDRLELEEKVRLRVIESVVDEDGHEEPSAA